MALVGTYYFRGRFRLAPRATVLSSSFAEGSDSLSAGLVDTTKITRPHSGHLYIYTSIPRIITSQKTSGRPRPLLAIKNK